MYVFFLWTESGSFWVSPKSTFKSFFRMPDMAFEVVCTNPRGSQRPGLSTSGPTVCPTTHNRKHIRAGWVGQAHGARLHQAENLLTCPPWTRLEQEQVRCHPGLQVSTRLSGLPCWPSDAAHGGAAGFQSPGHRKSHWKCLA